MRTFLLTLCIIFSPLILIIGILFVCVSMCFITNEDIIKIEENKEDLGYSLGNNPGYNEDLVKNPITGEYENLFSLL